MFEKFTLWLETDPTAKRKVILSLITVVVVFVLIFGIVWLNQLPQNTSTVEPANLQQNTKLSQNTFESAGGLEILDRSFLVMPQRVFFDENGENPMYIDNTLRLYLNGKSVENTQTIIPITMSKSGNNIFINESSKSSFYSITTKQFVDLPTNVSFMTVFSENNFVYISKEENSYKILQTPSFGRLANSTQLAEIRPTKEYSDYEMHVFDGKIYLFLFSRPSRTGDVEIWQINSNSAERVLNLQSIDSWKLANGKILYSQNLGTNEAKNWYIDLKDIQNPKEINVSTFLTNNKILGQIVASRCGLGVDKNIFCLVKQASTDPKSTQDKDLLLKINVDTLTSEILYQNLSFSGETIHLSPKGKMYLVSQELRQLYEFK